MDTLKGGWGYCICPGMIHGWPLATDAKESMDILASMGICPYII